MLAVFSLVRSTANAGGSLVLACGRADLAFYWNLLLLAFISVAVFFGAKTGALQGVAWTLLGSQVLLLFAWYHFVVKKLLGGCFLGFVGSIIVPVIFAVPMAGVVIGITPLLSQLPVGMQLATKVVVGAAIYVGLYLFFREEFVKEQLQLFFNRQ